MEENLLKVFKEVTEVGMEVGDVVLLMELGIYFFLIMEFLVVSIQILFYQ